MRAHPYFAAIWLSGNSLGTSLLKWSATLKAMLCLARKVVKRLSAVITWKWNHNIWQDGKSEINIIHGNFGLWWRCIISIMFMNIVLLVAYTAVQHGTAASRPTSTTLMSERWHHIWFQAWLKNQGTNKKLVPMYNAFGYTKEKSLAMLNAVCKVGLLGNDLLNPTLHLLILYILFYYKTFSICPF